MYSAVLHCKYSTVQYHFLFFAIPLRLVLQLEYPEESFSFVGQDSTTNMTGDQLQVFWSHFKKLAGEGEQFERPPTNWKPPAVRDMNGHELQAYWEAFRQIMNTSIATMSDQRQHGDAQAMDSKNSGFETNDGQLVAADGGCSKPPIQMKRLRRKTSATVYRALGFAERRENLGLPAQTKMTKVAKDDYPKKRKYTQSCKVARDGKQPCVSIWSKVKLFEES